MAKLSKTLEIRTSGGSELGVATDYGVLFLGRTARSGEVRVVAWFGDGPSVEASVIEPLGGGLYTAETEIRLPTIPMSFRTPEPGERLYVVGRAEGDLHRLAAAVRQDGPRLVRPRGPWRGPPATAPRPRGPRAGRPAARRTGRTAQTAG